MFSVAVVYPDDYDAQTWKLHLERVGRPEEPTKSRTQKETLQLASGQLVKALASTLSPTDDLVKADTIIYVDTVDAGPDTFQTELARRARIFNEAPIFTRMQKGSWAYVLLYPVASPTEYRSILAQLVSNTEADCANLFVGDPRNTAFAEQLSRHLTRPLLEQQLSRELTAAQREISDLKSRAPSSAAQQEQALQLEALTAQLANSTRRSTADIYALTTQLQQCQQAKDAELAAAQQQVAAASQAAAQSQQQLEAANQAAAQASQQLATDRASFDAWSVTKQQELEEVNRLVQEQAKKLGTVVPQLREASAELASLRAQLEDQSTQLSVKEQDITGCRSQLDSIITSGNAEFSRLSTELAGLKECPGQYEICSQQLAQLAEQNSQLQQDFQQLLSANQSFAQRNDELEADKQKLSLSKAQANTEFEAQIQGLKDILASDEDIQKAQQEQITALSKENESLRDRNSKLSARPDCTSAPEYLQLSEEKDNLEAQLAEKLEQYSQLETRFSQLGAELSAAQASIVKTELTAEPAQQKLAGKPLHEQISELQRELSDARELIAELEAELKRVKEALKQEKERAKPADCSEIEQVAQQRQDLIASQRKEIDKLQSQLEQAKKEVSDTTYATENQVLNLSASLDQCKDKVKVVEKQKEKLTETLEAECSTKLDDTIEEHKEEIKDFKEKAKEAIELLQKELETCASK